MDDNSFDGLDSLDFNPNMYYEDTWSNIGNLNADNLDNVSSNDGSNSPKIPFSRSNSKDVLGSIDFVQTQRNLNNFLENNRDMEQALRYPNDVPAINPSKRRRSPANSNEKNTWRGKKNISGSINTHVSNNNRKKKTANANAKANSTKSRNTKKKVQRETSDTNCLETSSSVKCLSSNSKSAVVNKNKKSSNKNRLSNIVKNRSNAKESKPPADSKEEIRRRRKNIREKERRQEVNDGFTVLMNLVGLHCQSDKARILNAAADTIQKVCQTNEMYKKAIKRLKHENETLRRVTKQYIYKLTKPVAELIKRSNGEITEASKKEIEAAIVAEQRKLQNDIFNVSGSSSCRSDGAIEEVKVTSNSSVNSNILKRKLDSTRVSSDSSSKHTSNNEIPIQIQEVMDESEAKLPVVKKLKTTSEQIRSVTSNLKT
jgi:hypothetical protein